MAASKSPSLGRMDGPGIRPSRGPAKPGRKQPSFGRKDGPGIPSSRGTRVSPVKPGGLMGRKSGGTARGGMPTGSAAAGVIARSKAKYGKMPSASAVRATMARNAAGKTRAPGQLKKLSGLRSARTLAPGRAAGPRGIVSGPSGRWTPAPRPVSNSPRRLPPTKGSFDRREGAASPMARPVGGVSPRRLPRESVGKQRVAQGGPDLGAFASGVSSNFGRGVAEAGRQIGGYAAGVKMPTNPVGSSGTIRNAMKTGAGDNSLKQMLRKR